MEARPICRIGKDEIVALLSEGDISIVTADVGLPLRWIANDQLYRFWKDEVKSHLADKDAVAFHLKNHPDEFCYAATRWKPVSGPPIVVLEKMH